MFKSISPSIWPIELVSLVEQELLTLPEHLSSTSVFSGIRVTRSLALYVCFVDRCLSFCTFFFWPLCCLFFFDIRILIAPLVSSNSSYSNSFFEMSVPSWESERSSICELLVSIILRFLVGFWNYSRNAVLFRFSFYFNFT